MEIIWTRSRAKHSCSQDAYKRGFCELLMLIGRGKFFWQLLFCVVSIKDLRIWKLMSLEYAHYRKLKNNIFGVQKKIIAVSWLRKLKQPVLKITCQWQLVVVNEENRFVMFLQAKMIKHCFHHQHLLGILRDLFLGNHLFL